LKKRRATRHTHNWDVKGEGGEKSFPDGGGIKDWGNTALSKQPRHRPPAKRGKKRKKGGNESGYKRTKKLIQTTACSKKRTAQAKRNTKEKQKKSGGTMLQTTTRKRGRTREGHTSKKKIIYLVTKESGKAPKTKKGLLVFGRQNGGKKWVCFPKKKKRRMTK